MPSLVLNIGLENGKEFNLFSVYVKLPHVLDMPNCAERDEFKIIF